MTYNEKILNLLKENNGIITGKQIQAYNIPRTYVKNMTDSKKIVRIARGIYADKTAWEDEMYMLQYRYKKAVFSHTTALYIHEMTDKTPEKFDITLPFGYKINYDKNLVKVTHVIKNIYDIGIEEGKTPCGRTVKVYNIERTICDILKANLDIQIVNYAIKRYIASESRNISKLISYAQKIKVGSKLENYLKVLL